VHATQQKMNAVDHRRSDEAEALGVPMSVGYSVRRLWGYAMAQRGGNDDFTTLITRLKRRTGVTVMGDQSGKPPRYARGAVTAARATAAYDARPARRRRLLQCNMKYDEDRAHCRYESAPRLPCGPGVVMALLPKLESSFQRD
jgi:hypothetical protein